MSPSPQTSAHTVANMRVLASGDGLCELASGVDALYLSGHGYLSKGLLAQLEEERMFADRVSVPVPFELGVPHFRAGPPRLGQVPLLPRPRDGADRLHLQPPTALGAHSAPGRVPPCGRARGNGATFRRPGATVH